MTRRVDNALDTCLASLANGSASLDECLARFPEHADELRPLLVLATRIVHVAPPTPAAQRSASGRARMLAALEEKRARRCPSVLPARGAPIRRWWVPRRLAAAGIVALVLVVAGALIGELFFPPIVARAATLESVDGAVDVWDPRYQVWQQARVGDRLRSGGRVRTGSDSSATLALLGSVVVDVASESEVELVHLRSTLGGRNAIAMLRQLNGGTSSRLLGGTRAIRRFEIKTPHARVRAQSQRGPLSFEVDVGENGTDVSVTEGRVSLDSGSGEGAVGTGETVRVEAGPARATPVPSAEPTAGRGGALRREDEDRHENETEEPGDGGQGTEVPDEGERGEDSPGGVGEGPAEGTPEPDAGDGHGGEETPPEDDPDGEDPEEGTPQARDPGTAEPGESGGDDDRGESGDGCEGDCTATPEPGSVGDDDGGETAGGCEGDCTPTPGQGSVDHDDSRAGDDDPGTG